MGGELTVTALTHRGAVRSSNQDALATGTLTVCVDTRAPVRCVLPTHEPLILAVADGVGGHAAGEIASEHVVRRFTETGNTITRPDQVVAFLHTLHSELQEHAQQYAEFSGMGTTIAGVLLLGGRAWWFNVGDSRVYQLNGCLTQLSLDDSPTLPPSPDGRPVSTSFITQCLGCGNNTELAPHLGEAPGGASGTWLLCSDGLSDLVAVKEMEHLIAEAGSDEAAVHALWQAAMEAGGKDNISILLART